MTRTRIGLIAAKLRRTDEWVVAELQAAGVRNSPRQDPLTIEELEGLVAHLRRKWRSASAARQPTTKPETAVWVDTATALVVKVRPPTIGLIALTPPEKREIAIALLNAPECVKLSMLGPRRQLRLTASELRKICLKKSSSIPSHSQVIHFLQSSEFTELQRQIQDEATKTEATLARFPGHGVAAKPKENHARRKLLLERLPPDGWREQE